MDIQSFIQSGLLESYLLGQCTTEERALVERMLAQHPAARTELAAIKKSLEDYAAGNAATPPAWLKGRILDIIKKEQNQSPAPAQQPPAVVSGSLRLFQLLTLVLALLSGLLFFQKNNLASERDALTDRADALQLQIDACAGQNKLKEKLQQVNALLRDRDDTRAVALSNGDNGKFTAYAYVNTARCEVAVDLNTLPAPAQGKYFQMWSTVDGVPVSMGMVDIRAAGGWLVLPCKTGATALAISQEANPNGNPAPTEVLMVGNLAPAKG